MAQPKSARIAPLLLVAAAVASGLWIEPVAPGEAGDGAAEGSPAAARVPAATSERAGEPPDVARDRRVGPEYACRVPEVVIHRKSACDDGLPYPACKWQLPQPYRAERTYTIWRNTVEEHLWGRPALIAVVLGAAEEYARHYPGEVLAVGDLDAAGPRHETHDQGVDVDLYLPGVMEVENLGGGEYAENYRGFDRLARRTQRARVETLARVLATCTQGRVRIYYNDADVRHRFQRWVNEQGLRSPFGRTMQPHNDLHRFHFHVTVPKDLPLPAPAGPTT
jgi:hypothetical protein